MGGKFFLVSGCLAVAYLIQRLHAHVSGVPRLTFLLVLAVFAFSLLGKFIGIGIARIRLVLLWRHLDGLLEHARMKTHVSMHQVGR